MQEKSLYLGKILLYAGLDMIFPPAPKHVRSAAGFVEAFGQGCGCTHLARVHKVSGAHPGAPR